MRLLCYTLAALLVASTARPQTPTGRSGLITDSLTYTRSNGTVVTLPVAFWYPTTAPAGTYEYPYVTGRVTLNAPTLAGPWPLIVHSHGLYECGLASGYLNEALANAGFIVAALDHEDASNCLITGGTRMYTLWNPVGPLEEEFPFRPEDVKALLDYVLAHPTWSPLVNHARIGASGHSLGGWTVSALHDGRITARLLWAPPYRQKADFYAGVPGPKIYLFGESGSGYYLPNERTWAYDHSSKPRFLGYVDNGDHYAMTDKVCRNDASTETCRARNVPGAFVARSLQFAQHYLAGDAAALADLTAADRRYLFWRADP